MKDIGVDALDFVIALNLLSRTTNDKKLKLLFELCDDDDDGCMTPEDILYMLKRVERVFAQECAKVNLDSTVLNHYVADQKAENNFHTIMGMIRYQNSLKQERQLEMRQKKTKDNESNSKKVKGMFEEDEDILQEDSDDNLITNKEFMTAINKMDSILKRILPRTLTFRDVLKIEKGEGEFTVSDTNVDDFAMFRYEINSIFRKHQFENEKENCELFIGTNPLSKDRMGNQIKDMDEAGKAKYEDMYRPPGLVKIAPTYYGKDNKPKIFELEESWIKNQIGNTTKE
jgi:hypothetical protein